MDIFLTQMHSFKKAYINPPGAMCSSFYDGWTYFLGFKMSTPIHCHYKAWKSQKIFLIYKYNPSAFSSSAFFGLLFLIFLLTIPRRFCMGFRSGGFAGQSSTPTPWSFNQLLVLLAVWAGAKSCWKMKSASLKPGQQKEALSAMNFLVNGRSDVGFQKTQWTNTSRCHCTPNHHRLWKLNTGLQSTWARSFSTLPPDSRTLVSK